MGKGELYALISSILYTFSVVFQRLASVEVKPLLGSFYNQLPMIFFGLILLSIGRSRQDTSLPSLKPRISAFFAIVAATLITYVFCVIIYFKALSISGAVIVTAGTSSQALWSGIFGWLLFKQYISKRTFIGLFIFIVGVFFLAISQFTITNVSSNWLNGLLLSLTIAILNGLAVNLIWYGISKGISQGKIYIIIGTIAVCTLGIAIILTGIPIIIDKKVLFFLLIGGILQSCNLAFFNLSLAHTSVISASTIINLGLIWSSIIFWIVNKDPLNFPIILSLITIVCGVLIAQIGRKR